MSLGDHVQFQWPAVHFDITWHNAFLRSANQINPIHMSLIRKEEVRYLSLYLLLPPPLICVPPSFSGTSNDILQKDSTQLGILISDKNKA